MDDTLQKEIQRFKMPQPAIGLPVLWYVNGIRRKQDARVAYLVQVGARTVTLYVSTTGKRMDAVRHIDDPKLNLSSDQREQGAWDYTEQHKEMELFKEDVRIRLDSIEKSINALITGAVTKKGQKDARAKAATNNIKRYHALKKQAESMGVEVVKGMSLEDVENKIKMRGAEPVAPTAVE